MKKTAVLLLILSLMVSGLTFLAASKRFDKASPKLGSAGTMGRETAANLILEEKAVGLVLLSKKEAVGLLEDGETSAFVSSSGGEKETTIVILCPGHSDYVKGAITLFQNHQDWIEVE